MGVEFVTVYSLILKSKFGEFNLKTLIGKNAYYMKNESKISGTIVKVLNYSVIFVPHGSTIGETVDAYKCFCPIPN